MSPRAPSALILAVALVLMPYLASAHCDSLDGPVVQDGRVALERGDPTPVLKWVRKEDEGEIREAFKKALAVRVKGGDARDLADRFFFETLVRIHRAGEGEGFTGLKAAGSVDPGITAADQALSSAPARSSPGRCPPTSVMDHNEAGTRPRAEEARRRKRRIRTGIRPGLRGLYPLRGKHPPPGL